MNWSLAFEPLLSWPLLAAVLVPLALLALAGLWFAPARRDASGFAALAALARRCSTRCCSTRSASR